MDNHFPHLTVGETLNFTARMRTPENRFPGISRKEYADHMAKVCIQKYNHKTIFFLIFKALY